MCLCGFRDLRGRSLDSTWSSEDFRTGLGGGMMVMVVGLSGLNSMRESVTTRDCPGTCL